MSRIGSRSLLLAIDAGSGYVDHTSEASRAVVTSGALINGLANWRGMPIGPRSHALSLTVAQDSGPGTLWTLVRTIGDELVRFYLAPHGNEFADTNRPHHTGWAQVTQPDGDLIGGDASPSRRQVLTVQMAWPIDGSVTDLTGGEEYPADLPDGW